MDPWNFDPSLGYTGDQFSTAGTSGSLWDTATGPINTTSIPEQVATTLATQGVRPSQFIMSQAQQGNLPDVQPQGLPSSTSAWDATPVQGPGPASPMPSTSQVPTSAKVAVVDPTQPQTVVVPTTQAQTVTPAEASASTQTPANMAATQTSEDRTNNFLKALQNVKIPQQPQAVKVETPRTVSPQNSQKITPQLVSLISSMAKSNQKPTVLKVR